MPSGPDYPPAFLARYELREVLGEGVSSRVYRAVQRELGRDVVVKVLRLEAGLEGTLAARFREEAGLLARLRHPRVVELLDYGAEDGVVYMTYPDEAGVPLSRRVSPGSREDPGEVARLLREAAEGLAALHEAGIVHRDLKPANILLTPAGNVKLLDLGLARDIERSFAMTSAGTVLGTPAYMAPGQVAGQPAAPADDLYALGVIGFELLTGTNPFLAGELPATLNRHCNLDPGPPHLLRSETPRGLSLLVHELLAKDRGDRPASAREVARRLGRAGGAAPPVAVAEPLRTATVELPGAAGARPPGSRPAPTSPAIDAPSGARILLTGGLVAACLGASFLLAPRSLPRPGGSHPRPAEVPGAPRRGPDPDLATRAREEMDRLAAPVGGAGAPVLSRDPAEAGRYFAAARAPRELRDFFLAGGDPRDLPGALREGLRGVDRDALANGWPRPFFPFLEVFPLDEPRDLGAAITWDPESPLLLRAPPATGWLAAAAAAFQEAERARQELIAEAREADRTRRRGRIPAAIWDVYVATLLAPGAKASEQSLITKLDSFYSTSFAMREGLAEWIRPAHDAAWRGFLAAARSAREEPGTADLAALLAQEMQQYLQHVMLGPLMHVEPTWLLGEGGGPPGLFLVAEAVYRRMITTRRELGQEVGALRERRLDAAIRAVGVAGDEAGRRRQAVALSALGDTLRRGGSPGNLVAVHLRLAPTLGAARHAVRDTWMTVTLQTLRHLARSDPPGVARAARTLAGAWETRFPGVDLAGLRALGAPAE